MGSTVSRFADRDITSWKSTDYLYKKEPCPLPTQARGLFTCMDGGEERIVARGYDKFFNINEVRKTSWQWIEENTHGPYELTVKEDGCLILAGGLDKGKTLLLTDKHSINAPHVQAASKWMEEQLHQAGKTCEELATFLYENNATAVFELCDDEFEEQILEYPERARGLYLHGINRNAVNLDTWPSAEVAKLATYFGFRAVERFEYDSIQEGCKLADKVRKDQALEGRIIEGFVVRCKLNGSDKPYMFKIKYDVPYLMFREWREVTLRIISKKPYWTTYSTTKHYASWVKQQLRINPDSFAKCSKKKGTIGLRKQFLEFYKQHGGNEEDMYEQISQICGETKVLLLPVGSIGCGKTTVSLALSRLFGFAHVQGDDMAAVKNARGMFQQAVLEGFEGHKFVVADRCNHIRNLRQALTSEIQTELVNCRIVALYWPQDSASAQSILDKNVSRVLARGNAHQSFTPARVPNFRRVMNGYMTAFAPLDLESKSDKLISDVVELDPLADSDVNLQAAVDTLCDMFPDTLKRPSAVEVSQALEEALAYKPVAQHAVHAGKKDKKAFYASLVPNNVNIKQWLEDTIATNEGEDWRMCRKQLNASEYNQDCHIELTNAASKGNGRLRLLYKGYTELFSKTDLVAGIEVACTADYIVSDGRVMALRVNSMITNNSDKRIPARIVKETLADGTVSIECVHGIPYIVLCASKNAEAAQASEMLKQVFGFENASVPQDCPAGWAIVPVQLSFTTSFEKIS
ncbi:trna ligase [Coemansia sp. RSA 2704]|nr:trna ligase [Coemansia sp. RSA 2705]KAJ2313396.1 trna ligase [Coemansia sp. RSA 2704]